MSGTQASKQLLREVMRERFGDPSELEKERDQPVIILPVPKRRKS